MLAPRGWCVLVFERNATPGGATQTMELTELGFRYVIGAINLNLLARSRFYAEDRETLTRKGVELTVANHIFGHFTAGGRFL